MKAFDILENADVDSILSGRDPSGLAAAAIYIATLETGQTRTQGEIETDTGITQVTIRKRCKELHTIGDF
jgi:transcription initiation factor TFIIB